MTLPWYASGAPPDCGWTVRNIPWIRVPKVTSISIKTGKSAKTNVDQIKVKCATKYFLYKNLKKTGFILPWCLVFGWFKKEPVSKRSKRQNKSKWKFKKGDRGDTMDFTFISNTCNGTIVYYLPQERTHRKQLVGFEPLRFRSRRCAQTISLPVLRCKMLSKVCYVNLSQSRQIEIWFSNWTN